MSGTTKTFYIPVGSIPEEDIEEYVMKVAAKFKKSKLKYPNDFKMPDFDITYANEYKKRKNNR